MSDDDRSGGDSRESRESREGRLRALLRLNPRVPLEDERPLGDYLLFGPWLMALDDLLSPYQDLVEHLHENTDLLEGLDNLNDLRAVTIGELIERM